MPRPAARRTGRSRRDRIRWDRGARAAAWHRDAPAVHNQYSWARLQEPYVDTGAYSDPSRSPATTKYRAHNIRVLAQHAAHLLGKGQTTLAKFLIIADGSDHPQLDAHDIPAFFSHVLERIRWERDLHFQTQTTMDTLDYSGSGWNAGSKVVMACRGQVVRTLGTEVPSITLPDGWQQLALVRPGILALSGVPFTGYDEARIQLEKLSSALASFQLESYPLIVLQDDAGFAAMNMSNFLWTTFTRTNPSHDIHGVRSFYQFKHWGCTGPLILDARTKPHHAPPLIPDPEVKKKVDTLFQRGGPLSGVLSS